MTTKGSSILSFSILMWTFQGEWTKDRKPTRYLKTDNFMSPLTAMSRPPLLQFTAANLPLVMSGDFWLPGVHKSWHNYTGLYDWGNIVLARSLFYNRAENKRWQQQQQQPNYQQRTATGEKMLAEAFPVMETPRSFVVLRRCVMGTFKKGACAFSVAHLKLLNHY